jgi:hypothetical protein
MAWTDLHHLVCGRNRGLRTFRHNALRDNLARELRKVVSVVRKEVCSGTLRHDIVMAEDEDADRCCVIDVSVVTVRRDGWVVPTAGEAAALVDEAAKARDVDAGKRGDHMDIEVARVLRKITRSRTLAPEIAARVEAKNKKYENVFYVAVKNILNNNMMKPTVK